MKHMKNVILSFRGSKRFIFHCLPWKAVVEGNNDATDGNASSDTKVYCQVDKGEKYILCHFARGTYMCDLKTDFEGTADVILSVSGPHTVSLTGSYTDDPFCQLDFLSGGDGGDIGVPEQSNQQFNGHPGVASEIATEKVSCLDKGKEKIEDDFFPGSQLNENFMSRSKPVHSLGSNVAQVQQKNLQQSKRKGKAKKVRKAETNEDGGEEHKYMKNVVSTPLNLNDQTPKKRRNKKNRKQPPKVFGETTSQEHNVEDMQLVLVATDGEEHKYMENVAPLNRSDQKPKKTGNKRKRKPQQNVFGETSQDHQVKDMQPVTVASDGPNPIRCLAKYESGFYEDDSHSEETSNGGGLHLAMEEVYSAGVSEPGFHKLLFRNPSAELPHNSSGVTYQSASTGQDSGFHRLLFRNPSAELPHNSSGVKYQSTSAGQDSGFHRLLFRNPIDGLPRNSSGVTYQSTSTRRDSELHRFLLRNSSDEGV